MSLFYFIGLCTMNYCTQNSILCFSYAFFPNSCADHWHYKVGGGLTDPWHYDGGSIITLVVLLEADGLEGSFVLILFSRPFCRINNTSI